MTGTPRKVGDALARFLDSLTPEGCQAMRYGTSRFFVQLIITPEEPAASEPAP